MGTLDPHQMAVNLSSQHTDASVFVFNTHLLFTDILDNPSSRKETAQMTDTTTYCLEYCIHKAPAPDFSDPPCFAPYDQYFWRDGMHPNPTVHKAIAAQIANVLRI